MFGLGVPRLSVNLRLITLMLTLLSLDAFGARLFYDMSSNESTFYTWALFECLSMLALVSQSLAKFSVHMIDLRLDNGEDFFNALHWISQDSSECFSF